LHIRAVNKPSEEVVLGGINVEVKSDLLKGALERGRWNGVGDQGVRVVSLT